MDGQFPGEPYYVLMPHLKDSLCRHLTTRWLSLSLIAGLALLLYYPSLYGMSMQWYQDADYSHGFLVPLLSLYFVWERREKLLAQPAEPDPWGAGILGAGLLMLIVGSIGAELYLQRSSLILVIAGLVLLLFGRQFLRVLAFPIVFLLFMVPLPAIVMNAVAFPLQLFAAKTAAFCLFNFGIPVLREGNVIVLAGTTLEVAEACSGIRSLQALLALGTVYAYFTQSLMWKRWVLVVLSVPIAIAANAFRVSGTGVLAHYWGVQAAEGFYHTFSGWLIFVLAFVLLLGCGAILSRVGKRHSRDLPNGQDAQNLTTVSIHESVPAARNGAGDSSRHLAASQPTDFRRPSAAPSHSVDAPEQKVP